MNFDQLTPTHQRMIRVLMDGLPHHRSELHACLDDELSGRTAVNKQLCTLRKITRTHGMDVICRAFGGRRRYQFQLVRLLAPAE